MAHGPISADLNFSPLAHKLKPITQITMEMPCQVAQWRRDGFERILVK